ncbi:MAG: hypothetical protein IPO30_08930 [Hyphomonadaceae bacterium]|nr:hypothetical protein [Hyphomonadaceae bacterium]
MSLMNIVRIAKIVALLAFVLPWVAVSCSVPGQGTIDLATASGIELIQGKMTANPDAEKQMGRGMGNMFGAPAGSLEADGGFGGTRDSGLSTAVPDLGMNFIGVGAATAIIVGLLLSFIGTGKMASRNVMITSLIGLVLVFGTVWWWKDQVKRQGNDGGGTAEASSPFGGQGDNPFGGGAGNPFGGGGMGGMGGQMLDQMLQERFGYWIALTALIVAAGAGAIGMSGGIPVAAKPDATSPPPAA